MRVVVTGLGAISGLGAGATAHREAFLKGYGGVRPLSHLRPDLPSQAWGGAVAAVQPDQQLRGPLLLRSAIEDALDDAGLEPDAGIKLFVGTAHGNLDAWQLQRRRQRECVPSPWDLLDAGLAPMLAAPEVTVVSTACTASSVAAGLAWGQLRSGQAQVALVAGVEVLTPFLYHGFESLRSLAPENCRPFDRARTGLVLGEGAAALVLETMDHARQRGAHILAEFLGYGFGSDASSLTAPDPRASGACAALREALKHAQIAGLPGFINAHGTGTPLNDRMECNALQRVFGEDAGRIALTSTKPLTGHMCGAAGAMELVATVAALECGHVPPILGFESPDREFAHLDFVQGEPRPVTTVDALTMNSGFGGTNTAIVLRKVSA